MKRNQVKIISNSKNHTLAFYYLNEQGKWCLATKESDLSRNKYTMAKIEEKASEIISAICSIYNPGNRGINLFFEGSAEEYQVILHTLETEFVDCNINCFKQETKIAVAGKIGSGKTTLINEIGRRKGITYIQSKRNNVLVYSNQETAVIWNEIAGIDIGKESMDQAKKSFESLAKERLTDFVYCLNTNKIEKSEEDFIEMVKNNYPNIKILLVLTMCAEENGDLYADELSKRMENLKVIPALAKDLKTRMGTILAYGLDDIERYIFEGK